MEKEELILEALKNPSITLEMLVNEGISESQVKTLLELRTNLVLYNESQTERAKKLSKHVDGSLDQTFEVIEELKTSLKDTLKENKKSVFLATSMFIITFLLGLALIGIAVYFGIQGKEILAAAFGSFGMINIVANLIADPPLKIQDSRSNYAQLTMASIAWFSDFVDKSALSSTVSQLNIQAQNSELDLGSKLKVQTDTINNYLAISTAQIDNTVRILTLIDEVAEPTKNKAHAKKE